MGRLSFRRAMLASAVAIGVGAAGPAPASAIGGFVLYETAGNPNVFTLFNNTGIYYVYDFQVSNPGAASDKPSTSRTGWTVSICGSCFGNIPGFDYQNTGGLADDLGPGQSSGEFFFSGQLGSSFTVAYSDSTGSTFGSFQGNAIEGSPPGGVPEPAAWVTMLLGMATVGGLARRRRSRPLIG